MKRLLNQGHLTAGGILVIVVFIVSLSQSCKKDEEEVARDPAIETQNVLNITNISAIVEGNITDLGSGITDHGHCWGFQVNPTVADSKTTLGTTGTAGIYTSELTDLEPLKVYHVRAYVKNGDNIVYGGDVSFSTLGPPSITSKEPMAVGSKSANLGGIITGTGGADVSQFGVYWGTAENPETTGTKVLVGSGIESFTKTIDGLSPNTTYYFKAYATNTYGTSYGVQKTFTTPATVSDIDGNVYNAVIIGTQTWMMENLRTTTYKDDSGIENITVDSLWMRALSGAYCWYNNDEASYKETYGALYNWYAVQTGKLCPDGWHMPSQAEWTALMTYLGGAGSAGGKMKEAGIVHWDYPNTNSTNESGFTGLPAGVRKPEFVNLKKTGSYWSISLSGSEPLGYSLSYDKSNAEGTGYPQFWGFSVRCIKD